MAPDPLAQEQLDALSLHLEARRAPVLEAWRKVVDSDPELTTGFQLSRSLFNDHIPEILDSFVRRLRAWPEEVDAAAQQQESEGTRAHGLHRWQQGFRLRELTREWGYLQFCLVDEIESYAVAHPELQAIVLTITLRCLTHLCVAGVSDSTNQYWELHQAEAAGHMRDLEQALLALEEIEKARAEGWQQAAHDLRGGVTVVAMASSILNISDVPASTHLQSAQLLQKSVLSLHDMLNNLMDLARLEAGQEHRSVAPFDAAVLLGDFCQTMQAMASAHNLSLEGQGPTTLMVEGDQAKVRRIVQNLVLNALKYTQQGGIVVSWSLRQESDARHWMVSVQDTGPGFHSDPGVPLMAKFHEATQSAHRVEENAPEEDHSSKKDASVPTLASRSTSMPLHQQASEGIGLSIVKGLCDLLDAVLEVESEEGRGSTFRVTFPSSYHC